MKIVQNCQAMSYSEYLIRGERAIMSLSPALQEPDVNNPRWQSGVVITPIFWCSAGAQQLTLV